MKANNIWNHYSGTDTQPLAGTGQGSGASPAMWLTICIVIIQAYCKLASKRMKFMGPTGSIASERSVDAFVDDTSIGITDYPKGASLSALTMLQLLEK